MLPIAHGNSGEQNSGASSGFAGCDVFVRTDRVVSEAFIQPTKCEMAALSLQIGRSRVMVASRFESAHDVEIVRRRQDRNGL